MTRRWPRAASMLPLAPVVTCALFRDAPAHADPIVYVLGEGQRAHGLPREPRENDVSLDALRGETASFQIVVEGAPSFVHGVTIDVPPLEGARGSLRVDAFVEHFVHIDERTRNEQDPSSSLGWTSASRPSDESIGTELPDALIPEADAVCQASDRRTFCPYPLHAEHAAMWFDVFVPLDAAPGLYAGRASVKGDARQLRTVDIQVRVRAARLPEAPISVFAYYAYDTLLGAFEDPRFVERSLLTMLHAHHVDAVTALTTEADATRVADAISGALYAKERGYRGAGIGRGADVVPIGAYGSLGDPSADSIDRALGIANAIPNGRHDVFVYAVDEACSSPRGADWKRALAGRVDVGQTCSDAPQRQVVDVVMMPADAFRDDDARDARAIGKKVFVYNGRLPRAGPMMLDAPLTSLTADGWIAASYTIGRWFFWETTFWNDENRGGKGPRDVFADPETFHNADGDACLLDGLLVYPGRNRAFPAHSLDVDDVMPSMRLEALRRGVEDAGLLALAASVNRAAALEIDERVVGAALDDAPDDAPLAFRLAPEDLAKARIELRAIIGDRDIALTNEEARSALDSLRAARRIRRSIVPPRARGVFVIVTAAVLFAVGLAVSVGLSRIRAVRASKRR